jgi:hypothetical protein
MKPEVFLRRPAAQVRDPTREDEFFLPRPSCEIPYKETQERRGDEQYDEGHGVQGRQVRFEWQ